MYDMAAEYEYDTRTCTVYCNLYLMIIISYGTARTFSDVQRAESSEFRKNYFIQKYGYSYRPADSKKII